MQRKEENKRVPFWSGTLGYPHAVTLAGSLIICGISLELLLGRSFNLPQAPYAAIFLSVLTLMSVLLNLKFKENRIFVWLSGFGIFLTSIASLALLSLIMAVFPHDLTRSWPFVLLTLLLIINLTLCLIKNVRRSLLIHIGVLLLIWGMVLSSSEMIKGKTYLIKGNETSVAVSDGRYHFRLPFALKLKDIKVTGSDLKPNYRSYVTVTDKGRTFDAEIEVNKPLKLGNWLLYQYAYANDSSVIEAVYDPWLYLVYAGIFILMGGVLVNLFRGMKR